MNHKMLTEVKNLIYRLFSFVWGKWDHWWFRPRSTSVLGLFRLLLTGTLFYMALMRSFHLDYYTDASWMPRSLRFFVMPEMLRPPFSWFFWSDSWGPFFHYLLVLCLGLIFIGVGNRLLVLIAWILQIAFIQRNYSIVFGADHIGTILLFLLSLTNCFESWTVKSFLVKKWPGFFKFRIQSHTDILGSVGVRLLQIQMCTIYCYTGLEKLKGSSWWEGTALWNVLANPQQTVADFTFIKHFPFFIAFMTFFTVIYEIFWPVAVNSRKTKNIWLGLGVLFHLGIGITMGLMVFSLVMTSTYLLFLSDLEYQKYFVSNWEQLKKKVGF